MKILLIIITGLFLLWLFSLYAHGKAADWMKNPSNVRRMRKHYEQEGITIFVNDYNKTVDISFYHKDKYFSKSVSFVNAMAFMEKTLNGGIRKLLLKKLK